MLTYTYPFVDSGNYHQIDFSIHHAKFLKLQVIIVLLTGFCVQIFIYFPVKHIHYFVLDLKKKRHISQIDYTRNIFFYNKRT